MNNRAGKRFNEFDQVSMVIAGKVVKLAKKNQNLAKNLMQYKYFKRNIINYVRKKN